MRIRTSQEIGEKIKEFRKLRGLTQEQLAVGVEVTFQQIQKYESGATRLNTDKLQAVANALDVPVSAFFDVECKYEELLSEEEQKLIKRFRTISNQDVREYVISSLQK